MHPAIHCDDLAFIGANGFLPLMNLVSIKKSPTAQILEQATSALAAWVCERDGETAESYTC